MPATGIDVLTPRELEILTMIAEGDSLPEIAQKLYRSLKTIESHRLSLGRKLGASNRVELAKIAIAQGLVAMPGQSDQEHGAQANHSEQELAWLKQINDVLGKTSGRKLLQRFCEAASVLPGVNAAAICTTDTAFGEPQDKYRRIIKATSEGGKPGQIRRFHAADTACKILVDEGEHIIHEGACEAYPDDPWVQELQAQSYMGLSITDPDGAVVGGAVLIGRDPMPQVSSLRKVVEFFVPRIAGALQISIDLDKLQAEHHRLNALQSRPTLLVEEESASELHEHIAKRVDHEAGIRFLREIVDAMCEQGEIDFAGICRLDDARVARMLTTVILRQDRQIVDNISYAVAGTPCECVLDEGRYCIETDAPAAFPDDILLVQCNIDSYAGVRLTGPDGQSIGTFWIANTKPLENGKTLLEIAEHYAARISAELQQHLLIEQLMQEREQIRAEQAVE